MKQILTHWKLVLKTNPRSFRFSDSRIRSSSAALLLQQYSCFLSLKQCNIKSLKWDLNWIYKTFWLDLMIDDRTVFFFKTVFSAFLLYSLSHNSVWQYSKSLSFSQSITFSCFYNLLQTFTFFLNFLHNSSLVSAEN